MSSAGVTSAVETLKNAVPAYAKDLKLNLSSVLGNSPLGKEQLWGAALACAIAARGEFVLRAITEQAREELTEEAYTAASAAASVMAMNNVYYRTKHQLSEPAYRDLSARLRMRVIAEPGVEKTTFELWCLSVSAINGCSACVDSHEKTLTDAGVSRETVHEAIRLASVIHAASVTFEADSASATLPPERAGSS